MKGATLRRLPLASNQVLLEYGADRHAVNKEGKKPADVAKNAETVAALAI